MISWIQTRFKKHTRVALVFLLLVVAIPFVFSINGGLANWWTKEGEAQKRDFFGHNIASLVEMRRLTDDVRLSVMIQVGYQMPSGGAKLEEEALARAASLALADRFGIAQPSATELQRHIAGLRLFADAHGVFDPKRYESFREELRSDRETKEADIARVLGDDIRIRLVERLLAGPGYVAPREVELGIAQSTTEWLLNAAVYDLAGFAEPAAPSDAELAAYFTAHVSTFEVPEQVRADYVRFPVENFLGREPLPDEEVVDYFERNRAQFVGAESYLRPGREPALAAVRPQVEEALRAERAGRKAEEAAWNLVGELFEQKLERNPAVAGETIARHRGELATAPLFVRKAVPKGLSWTNDIVEAAFRLGPDRIYSDALPFGRDHIVLLWRETIPPRRPRLEEVRDQVLADFRAHRQRTELRRLGGEWKWAIEGKLASGLALETACANLTGAPKVRFALYGPFTRRQPPEGIPEVVLNALGDRPALALTDLVLGENEAYLVQVVGKRSPRVDPASPDYEHTAGRLRTSAANQFRASVLRDVVQTELARTDKAAK